MSEPNVHNRQQIHEKIDVDKFPINHRDKVFMIHMLMKEKLKDFIC